MCNHGVTTPYWDRLFGTSHEPPARIRVPRRQAPDWLLDAAGAVRPEFDADYELAGPPAGDPALTERDRRAAWANRAPE
jgi:hypothetical protein